MKALDDHFPQSNQINEKFLLVNFLWFPDRMNNKVALENKIIKNKDDIDTTFEVYIIVVSTK